VVVAVKTVAYPSIGGEGIGGSRKVGLCIIVSRLHSLDRLLAQKSLFVWMVNSGGR